MKIKKIVITNAMALSMIIILPNSLAEIEEKIKIEGKSKLENIKPKLVTVSKGGYPNFNPDGFQYAAFFRWLGKQEKSKFIEIVKDNFPVNNDMELEKLFEFSNRSRETLVDDHRIGKSSICEKVSKAEINNLKISNEEIRKILEKNDRAQQDQFTELKLIFHNTFKPSTVNAIDKFLTHHMGVTRTKIDYLSQVDINEANSYHETYKIVCQITR